MTYNASWDLPTVINNLSWIFPNKSCPSLLFFRKNTQFHWSPEAQHTFNQLKLAFTTAPILAHSSVTSAFTVEVDASSTAIRAVLSSELVPNKCYTHVLITTGSSPLKKLWNTWQGSPGDKTIFAEWWHYLEVICYPVQMFTDHKNLEYLYWVKALNLLKLQCALFFLTIWFRYYLLPPLQKWQGGCSVLKYHSTRSQPGTNLILNSHNSWA